MEALTALVAPASALGGVVIGALLEHWRQRSARTHEARTSAYRRFLSLHMQMPTQTILAASDVAKGSVHEGASEAEQVLRNLFLGSAVDRVKQMNEVYRQSVEGLAELALVGSKTVVERAREVGSALLELSLEIPKALMTSDFDADQALAMARKHGAAVRGFTEAARKDLGI